jgi:oxygen-dependent protoporphyrinogen oxidase
MGQLVDALICRLAGAVEIRLSCPVNRLKGKCSSWKVGIPGTTIEADAVVLAVPARQMAALLEPELGSLQWLTELPSADSITVSIAAPNGAVNLPDDASGFIADGAGAFRGCSICSAKFDQRAPKGWQLLRLFFRPDAGSNGSDQEWVERARAILRAAVGLDGRESRAWISRWPGALPQYPAGFTERAATLLDRAAELGRIALCGSAVTIGGIDGAVRSAGAAFAVSSKQ